MTQEEEQKYYSGEISIDGKVVFDVTEHDFDRCLFRVYDEIRRNRVLKQYADSNLSMTVREIK